MPHERLRKYTNYRNGSSEYGERLWGYVTSLSKETGRNRGKQRHQACL